MGAGCLSPRSIVIFNQPVTWLPLTPKPASLFSHGGSEVMIVQSNISLVLHAVLIHWMLYFMLPVLFLRRTLYTPCARSRHSRLHKCYFLPHFVPISQQFSSRSIINCGPASSIIATILTDSQSQIRSTLNVRPSNKTTKRVISSDVAILEGRTSCLPGPHLGLLQTDLVTHSAHAKWYRQGKGLRFGRSKHFTRPVVAILTSLQFIGGGLNLC